MTAKPRAKIHCLKAWPEPFLDVAEGRKTFEYRLADRDYRVGDVLVLQEYNPERDSLTGECTAVRVLHILYGGKFGIPERYCVMSIAPLAEELRTRAASGDEKENR